MAEENIIRNTIQWETDERSVSNSIQKAESLTKTQVNVAKGIEAETAALKQLTQAEKDAADAANKRVDAQSRKPTGGAGTAGGGGFEAVSKDVAIYGDVESQVRTLSGAIGYLGGESGAAAESIINVGAEMFAVTEAAPKLAAGIGDAALKISNSVPLVSSLAGGLTTLAPALGATGAAVIAVAAPLALVAAAVAALTLVLKGLSDAAEAAREAVQDQAEASKKRIETEREIADFQEAADREGAQKRIAALKKEQEDANKYLTELYVQLDETKKQYEALGAALDPAKRNELGAIANELEGLIDEEQKVFDARAKEIGQLETALPTIEDGTQKEQALANARSNTATASDSAAQAEQKQAQAAKEAEQKAKELAQAQQQLADATAAAQRKYDEAITKASNTLSDAAQDIGTDLSRSLADLNKNLLSDITKLATDFQRSEYESQLNYQRTAKAATRSYYDDLNKIQTDANRAEKKLLRDRDFLNADLLAESTQNQISDRKTAADIEAREREINNKQEAEDRLRHAQETRTDRLRDYQTQQRDARTASQRQRQDALTAYDRQIRDAGLALQSELATAQAGYQSKLQLEQQYYTASLGLVANAIRTVGGMGGATGSTVNLNFNGGAMTNNQVAGQVIGILQQGGYIPSRSY